MSVEKKIGYFKSGQEIDFEDTIISREIKKSIICKNCGAANELDRDRQRINDNKKSCFRLDQQSLKRIMPAGKIDPIIGDTIYISSIGENLSRKAFLDKYNLDPEIAGKYLQRKHSIPADEKNINKNEDISNIDFHDNSKITQRIEPLTKNCCFTRERFFQPSISCAAVNNIKEIHSADGVTPDVGAVYSKINDSLLSYRGENEPGKAAYSAIVYTTGTDVLAEDSNGVIIARGIAGEDDRSVLSAAITLIGSGKIIIASSLIFKGLVRLNGQANLALVGLPGVTITRNHTYYCFDLVKCNHITFEGLEFIRTDSSKMYMIHIHGSSDVTLRKCKFHEHYAGIWIGSYSTNAIISSRVIIENCEFYNYYYSCITLSDGWMHVIILNNFFHDSLGEGAGANHNMYVISSASLGTNDIEYPGGTDLKIIANSFQNHKYWDALGLHGGNDILVEGNSFESIGAVAIAIHNAAVAGSSPQNNDNWLILNNLIHNAWSGILAYADNIDSLVSNVIVAGNIIKSIGLRGITARVNSGKMKHIIIADNVVSGNKSVEADLDAYGIYVGYSGKYTEDINIENNIIDSETSSAIDAVPFKAGINAIDCIDLNISGNQIIGKSLSPQIITAGIMSDCQSGVSIQNNIIKSCDIGIKILKGSNDHLINNKVGCDVGIDLNSNCTDTCVEFNTLSSCTTPISNNSAIGLTIRYNKGYVTENSGFSRGTGSLQTIAHGLASTPKRVDIVPIESGTVTCKWADPNNIYVLVTNGVAYTWSVEA